MAISTQLFCAPPPVDRYGVVYVATQRESGKQYVGQTKNTLEKRWNSHVHGPSKGISAISAAIKKYGSDAFTLDILDWAMTKEELDHKEKFWIAFLDTIGVNGYNLNEGGYDGKRHPDSVARQSARMMGNPCPTKGIPHTEEHKANISAGLNRYYIDHDGPNKGKSPSPEARAKNAEAQKGRTLPPNHPWRQPGKSSWNKGKKMSPEHHIIHAAGLKRRYAEHPTPLKGRLCPKLSRPIMCVETGQIYPSQALAGKSIRPNESRKRQQGAAGSIAKAAKKGWSVYGFHWRYVSDISN